MEQPLTPTLLQQNIINYFQKNFPLISRPYKQIAVTLSSTEEEVLEAVRDLYQKQALSRVGPVFDHKKAGSSTLAALAVPKQHLDSVARIVNQLDQVNHNYVREHKYNLWFVITAKNSELLDLILEQIQDLTGYKILILPMEKFYHIDLGFKIKFNSSRKDNTKDTTLIPFPVSSEKKQAPPLSQRQDIDLKYALEKGLETTSQPYLSIAKLIDCSEQQVMNQIHVWQTEKLIRRFGLVVNHRNLGFTANAMVVWDIDNENVDSIASKLAKYPEVSLCYRRPRSLPDWPYNLFCMIHGTDRHIVLRQIAKITKELSLDKTEKAILFSTKAYKQHGARYSATHSALSKIKNYSIHPNGMQSHG